MEASEIIFDKNLNMSVFSKDLNKKIRIVLSDELIASEEELTNEYRERIANFVNELPIWHKEACDAVLKWAKHRYKIEALYQDIQLMCIFILFEPNEDDFFGLEFRSEFDVEHGCGLQIKRDGRSFKVVKMGIGDIAFG